MFYTAGIGEFLIDLIDSVTVELTHTLGTFATDLLTAFENFSFDGVNYTRAQLDDYVAGGGGQSVETTRLVLSWPGGGKSLVNDEIGTFTYSGEDLGQAGVTQDVLSVTRSALSVEAQVLNPSAGEIDSVILRNDVVNDVTLQGFRSLEVDQDGSVVDTDVSVSQAMRGRVTTGTGNDTITVTLQEIVAFNPSDVDQWFITSGSGNDQITIDGAITNMFGSITAGDGDDVVDINVQGNDTVYGGAGDDTIHLGNGADIAFGGADADTINGEAGDDRIYGEAGADILTGGAGFDRLEGGLGNDDLSGGAQSDALFGDEGDDTLNGGSENDTLRGGDDNDTLNGDDGNDQLFGDDGIDVLNGGAGNDIARGGNGDDTIHGDSGSDKLYGEDGNDVLYGDDGFDALYGGLDNDTLFGGLDNDRLYGQDGNDRLDGGAGNDILSAGAGTDVMIGGAGADRFYGGTGQDTFALSAFDGSPDRFYGFTNGQDVINITDILTGYNHGVDDIADFVLMLDLGNGTTDLRVDADGSGGYARAALIYTDLGGASAQDLLNSGTLVTDVSV